MQVRLADALVADGRAEEAVEMCRRGLRVHTDDIPLRLALGRALSAAGQLEEAAAALMDAAQRGRRAAAEGRPPAKPAARRPAFAEEPQRPPTPAESEFDAAPTRAVGRPLTRDAAPAHEEDDDDLEIDVGFAPATPSPRAAAPQRPSPFSPRPPKASLPNRNDRHDPTEPTEVISASEAGAAIDLDAIAQQLLGGEIADAQEATLLMRQHAESADAEIQRGWNRRRGRAFIYTWIGLVLAAGGIVGGYLYQQKKQHEAEARQVIVADQRGLEATFAADLEAHEIYAQLVRDEPHTRAYFSMVALANGRLAAEHGEDAEPAGWAMLKRAEKEHQRRQTTDERADRDERQARALLALARAESCTPTEPSDGDIAARCALQRGDSAGARTLLAGLVKQPGTAAVRGLLVEASANVGAGDLDAADRDYSDILTRVPGHPRATVGRLLVALERGENPTVTIPEGRLGVTTEAWFHLATGIAGLGNRAVPAETAGAELDLALRGIVHDGRLALLYGRARLLQGRVAEAEHAMRVAERLEPNDPDVAVLDAEVALSKGLEDKVATTLSQSASPRQLAVLGKALCLVGKYKEAEADLRAALARRPGDATALTYLNIARAKQGDIGGAIRALDRAAKDSTSTAPHYGLGLLAYERHDLARAQSELRQATDRNTEAFRARALLGKVLLEVGKPEEALPLLEAVSNDAPSLNEVHATLGRLYRALGRDREARSELKQLVDANHINAEEWALLTEATLALGLTAEGAESLASASSAKGANSARLARLKLVLESWKGPKEALVAGKAFDKERKGPAANDPQLALWCGDAWRRAGELKHAEESYRAALAGDPLHANLALGKIALAQNQSAVAEGSYRAAIATLTTKSYGREDQSEAHLGLARALLARKASADAMGELDKAIAADPSAPEPHYWMAHVQSDKGQGELAIMEAGRATELDDHYADAFELLGDLTRKGQHDRAKKAYKRYLELKPDGSDAKIVKRQLAALK